MAFTFSHSQAWGGLDGTAVTNPSGATPTVGQLVVAYVHADFAGNTIVADADSGAGWISPIQEDLSGETSRHAIFWRIANATEPASYDWTLDVSNEWQTLVYVFSSAADAVVDATATSHIQVGNNVDLIVGAVDGVAISDGAVSFIFAGKDFRSGSNQSPTTADNSYIGVDGNTRFQNTAGAYRIYTADVTFSGNVTITDVQGDSDKTYSIHISFIEPSAAAGYTSQLSLMGMGS